MLPLRRKLPERPYQGIGRVQREGREICLFFRQQEMHRMRHVRGDVPGLRDKGI